jgi:hypothetical protein
MFTTEITEITENGDIGIVLLRALRDLCGEMRRGRNQSGLRASRQADTLRVDRPREER